MAVDNCKSIGNITIRLKDLSDVIDKIFTKYIQSSTEYTTYTLNLLVPNKPEMSPLIAINFLRDERNQPQIEILDLSRMMDAYRYAEYGGRNLKTTRIDTIDGQIYQEDDLNQLDQTKWKKVTIKYQGEQHDLHYIYYMLGRLYRKILEQPSSISLM